VSKAKIRAVVDSGAQVSAIPYSVGASYPAIRDGKTGTEYSTACGTKVTDKGRKELWVKTDGKLRGVRGRSTDVKRMFLAVYDLCAAGHRVVFDLEEGSRAEHKKTGGVTPFVLRGRSWEIDFEVLPYETGGAVAADIEEEVARLCPFTGQAQP
jgi:hypothetical protein